MTLLEAMSLLGHDPADIVAADEANGRRLLHLISTARPRWMRDALCAEFDIDLWFPGIGQRSDPALQICGRCPVRVECLDEALADESLDHGIRGGQTAQARKLTRRARAREGGPSSTGVPGGGPEPLPAICAPPSCRDRFENGSQIF